MTLISRAQPSVESSLWTTQQADGRNLHVVKGWFLRAFDLKIDKPNLDQGLNLIAARKTAQFSENELEILREQLATVKKEPTRRVPGRSYFPTNTKPM